MIGLAVPGHCRSAWAGQRAAGERREQRLSFSYQSSVIVTTSPVSRECHAGSRDICDRLTNGHTLSLAPLHPHNGQQGEETEEQE